MNEKQIMHDACKGDISHPVVQTYHNAVDKYYTEQNEWIESLRKQGFMVAHPDDGWVDRKENKIHLCYPHFQDKNPLEIGDRIVLGWHTNTYPTRIVEITNITSLKLDPSFLYYHFREIEGEHLEELKR